MSKECCIVGAGPSPVFLKDNSFIIAADGGLEKLKKIGISPNLIMGDFDSSDSDPSGEAVICFPAEKDDTDTLLAIKKAIDLGYDTLYISGGIGGRLDHTVANIQALCYASEHGVIAFLCGDNETAAICSEKIEFRKECKGKISVFCMGDIAENTCIEGLKYQARNLTLKNSFPIGVSNEFIGKPASIALSCGKLLIIWQGNADDVTAFTVKKNLVLALANEQDSLVVEQLYNKAKKQPFCVWDKNYPTIDNIKYDISKQCLFVLKLNTKIIGAVSVVFDKELDCFDCFKEKGPHVAEIGRITIDSDFSGNGYAALMLQKLMTDLKKFGYNTVHLSVAKCNIPAYKTYIKLGFFIVGQAPLYNGEYFLLEKTL